MNQNEGTERTLCLTATKQKLCTFKRVQIRRGSLGEFCCPPAPSTSDQCHGTRLHWWVSFYSVVPAIVSHESSGISNMSPFSDSPRELFLESNRCLGVRGYLPLYYTLKGLSITFRTYLCVNALYKIWHRTKSRKIHKTDVK